MPRFTMRAFDTIVPFIIVISFFSTRSVFDEVLTTTASCKGRPNGKSTAVKGGSVRTAPCHAWSRERVEDNGRNASIFVSNGGFFGASGDWNMASLRQKGTEGRVLWRGRKEEGIELNEQNKGKFLSEKPSKVVLNATFHHLGLWIFFKISRVALSRFAISAPNASLLPNITVLYLQALLQ